MARIQSNRCPYLFILSFPLRQHKSFWESTTWCSYKSFEKTAVKLRTCRQLPFYFSLSWNRSKKRKQPCDPQQWSEANNTKNSWIRRCNFRLGLTLHFVFWAAILLTKQLFTYVERIFVFSVHCSFQENSISNSCKLSYLDSKFHPSCTNGSDDDDMLNDEKVSRKSSPRLAKARPLRRSVIEQVQPFLYRKAKQDRLSLSEERQCLYILQTYRKLEEMKLERESLLKCKVGSKEWSHVCNLSVFEIQKWNKVARRAKHLLITSHLQLINAICRDFLHKGLSFDDLVQEGVLGLLKAVEKFDLSKGVRFSTYAAWWIRQSLQRALSRHQHLIRLPVHISDALKSIRRERWFLSHQLGQYPNMESLSKQTGISYNKVVYYCRLALYQLPSYSLEEKKPQSQRNHGRHRDSCTCALYDMFLREDLEKCFSVLKEKERDILCLRYGWKDGKPKTLNEIGCIFEMTEEGVRRLERRALAKIRNCAQIETLKYYL